MLRPSREYRLEVASSVAEKQTPAIELRYLRQDILYDIQYIACESILLVPRIRPINQDEKIVAE